MFNRDNKPASRIDTLIGRTVRIHGDLDFTGGLHIDGHVAGNVRAQGDTPSFLSISEGAGVGGSVVASAVVLEGTVGGDVRASGAVVLGPRSRVDGNVWYGSIEMATGAQINGKLSRATALTEPRADPKL